MITQYLLQILVYHVEFKVYLVVCTYLVHVFYNSESYVSFCNFFKKCMIKQLLNLVFA